MLSFILISQRLLAQRNLTEYTGVYTFPAGSVVERAEVTLSDSLLWIEAPIGSAKLKWESGDRFIIPEYQGSAEFLRDSLKQISGIKVNIELANISLQGQKLQRDTSGQRSFDLQAHQGGCGLWPCNTVRAFINATRLGVTTLELDCVISKDSLVIVSHDHFMTAGTLGPDGKSISPEDQDQYKLFAMTYSEIEHFDTGSAPDKEFSGQEKFKAGKPMLEEVISAVEEFTKLNNLPAMHYNIEIKSLKGDNIYHPEPVPFSDLVMRVVNTTGITSRTMIQSFDVRALQYLHKKYPQVALSYLIHNQSTLETNLQRLGFTPAVYSPHFRLVSPELTRQVRAGGMKLIPWTVDTHEDLKRIMNTGIDGIITNYPDRAMKILKTGS